MTRKGLGLVERHDDRNANYPLAAIVRPQDPGPAMRGYRYWWSNGWRGDQGATPQCVAYAVLHELADGPHPHQGANPAVEPRRLYCDAQKLDPWPGDCQDHRYDGTSLLAGAQAAQQHGLITEYRWAWDVDTIVNAILHVSPVVFGSEWWSGMWEPDAQGFLWPTGRREGGHAYVLNGVNVNRGYVRVKNSWGTGWGTNGHAKLALEDLDELLDEWGEALYLKPAK